MKAPLKLIIADADGNILHSVSTDESIGQFLALLDDLDPKLADTILDLADAELRGCRCPGDAHLFTCEHFGLMDTGEDVSG